MPSLRRRSRSSPRPFSFEAKPRCSAISILVAVAVLVLWPIRGSAQERPAGKKPTNILFIFSDDHAYQAIGAYGFGLNKTPNIARVAAEGMRFTRCLTTNSLAGRAGRRS